MLPATLAVFADKTVILIQNYNLAEAAAHLQIAMDTISTWFTRWNIQVNPNKCQMSKLKNECTNQAIDRYASPI